MKEYLSNKKKKLELEEYLESKLKGSVYGTRNIVSIDIFTLYQPDTMDETNIYIYI